MRAPPGHTARMSDETSPNDDAAQLDALLAEGARRMGVELDAATRTKMLRYQEALLDETTRVNLTGIHDPRDAVVRHLLDSVSVRPAWESLRSRAPRRILDLGTGGGVPGAILAALWPRSRALLVDGTRKKLDAVDRCLAHAGIENADTLHSRGKDVVRELPATRRAFDLCVARAVGRCPKLLDELRHLVAVGGLILLMKGPEIDADEREATERKAATLRLTVLPDVIAQVPGLEPRRILVFERGR